MSALAWLGRGAPCAADVYGQKAHGLSRLSDAGHVVPSGFALAARHALALTEGAAEPTELAAALDELRHELGSAARIAVRASPALDLPGALPTFLDQPITLAAAMAGVRAIVQAVRSASVRDQLAARAMSAPTEPWVGVLVQAYVAVRDARAFGAVVCSCDPRSGSPAAVGELNFGAGVAPVVSGRTQPRDLVSAAREHPECAERIASVGLLAHAVEALWGAPVELELIAEHDTTHLIEVRPLTLSPAAIVARARAAVDRDDPDFARRLVEVAEHVLPVRATLDAQGEPRDDAVLRGLCACAGSASGVAVFDAGRAVERATRDPVILVRDAAEPGDVAGFRAARAVLTTTGGITCHAAVIARSLGVPALVSVCGLGPRAARSGAALGPDGVSLLAARGGEVLVREGDRLFVDAARGLVYPGEAALVPVHEPELSALFQEIRKLRPRPLWVEGPLEEALDMREACALDGVLVRGPTADAQRVARRGREVYWCLGAAEVRAHVASLPAGYGVVLEEPDGLADVQELQGLLRGRSLGVLTRAARAPLFRGAGIDVLVLEGAAPPHEDALEGIAPRTMWRGAVPPHAGAAGLIVAARAAPAAALHLTGQRANKP